MPSRRAFLGSVGAAVIAGRRRRPPDRPFRLRTITAGVTLAGAGDVATIERTIAALERGRRAFEAAGYVVQTLRIATQPLIETMDAAQRDAALAGLQAIGRAAADRNVVLSLGPVLTETNADDSFAPWAAELVRTTRTVSITVRVASPDRALPRAAASAAQAMVALASVAEGGVANFRFAAAANVPAGTPFFPVAWHRGPDSLAVGVESANVVGDVFAAAPDPDQASLRLRERLDADLAPVEATGAALARGERRAWLGVDPSPAPSPDRSIGAAIEALTHLPFGSASTLRACAAVTEALRMLRVRTCGYAGLMLPVLEDPVLARRAGEGRYGVRELLLYSSVCGTGLDVVPLPGNISAETLKRIILDVAALSVKLRKPLSARLFPVPGKAAGEIARFTDPYLTDSAVFSVDES